MTEHRIFLDTYRARQVGLVVVYDADCICGEYRQFGALSEITLINDLMEHAFTAGYRDGVRYGSCP